MKKRFEAIFVIWFFIQFFLFLFLGVEKDRFGLFFLFFFISIVAMIIIGEILKKYSSAPRNNSSPSNYRAPIVNKKETIEKELTKMDEMGGHDFEVSVSNLLRKNGYQAVTVTKGSGDNGIDILANKDGEKVGFQCKRYAGNVGNRAIQEVFTGKQFYKLDRAIVITNAFFTPSAELTARKTGVELWTRKDLKALIETALFNDDKVRTSSTKNTEFYTTTTVVEEEKTTPFEEEKSSFEGAEFAGGSEKQEPKTESKLVLPIICIVVAGCLVLAAVFGTRSRNLKEEAEKKERVTAEESALTEVSPTKEPTPEPTPEATPIPTIAPEYADNTDAVNAYASGYITPDAHYLYPEEYNAREIVLGLERAYLALNSENPLNLIHSSDEESGGIFDITKISFSAQYKSNGVEMIVRSNAKSVTIAVFALGEDSVERAMPYILGYHYAMNSECTQDDLDNVAKRLYERYPEPRKKDTYLRHYYTVDLEEFYS